MTDTLGRMHSDAQFAGSSSVPAHVEMMGFLGMGNNPMVGATVAVAVAVQQAMKQSVIPLYNGTQLCVVSFFRTYHWVVTIFTFPPNLPLKKGGLVATLPMVGATVAVAVAVQQAMK